MSLPNLPNESAPMKLSSGRQASSKHRGGGTLVAGIDVGSTFTDLVLLDPLSGEASYRKVLSTPHDQSEGFLASLLEEGVGFEAILVIVHGTTVATNTTIQRKGARAALVTTKGFRDILELRNRARARVYGLGKKFEPLIPRECRFEVSERLAPDGAVITPLAEDELRRAIDSALSAGCESLAISFLHSYANGKHEQRAKEIAEEVWPNSFVSTSSDLLSEIREFERTSTVAANAYVQPGLARYLTRVKERLADAHFQGDLFIVQSNGGLAAIPDVNRSAVATILSGPAAGVAAASGFAGHHGYQDFVTMDMGGTSLDVCVITGGEPAFAQQKEIAFGIPIRVPIVDIETVGIGGGSIARIDDSGLLRIGPQSAGADPGPAAYGRGGMEPTVTDANLVLGRLTAGSALSQAAGLSLDSKLASSAIMERIGRPLGLDLPAAASAILMVTENQMTGHIRRLTVERGHDPREYALVAFGGAGPLHAAAIMKGLGLEAVLIPPAPGVFSAAGCATGDFRHDFVQTIYRPLQQLTSAHLRRLHSQMVKKGLDKLEHVKSMTTSVEIISEADLLFDGQSHALQVRLGQGLPTREALEEAFIDAYRARYGRVLDLPIFILNLRASVVAKRAVAWTQRNGQNAPAGHTQSRQASSLQEREVYFDKSPERVRVLGIGALGRLPKVTGPAIIEESDTTVIVPRGVTAQGLQGGGVLLIQENEGRP